jgi:hypothetical protein
MGQMVGADPEQLDALGNQMSTSADRLDCIRAEISALLSHSHWDGPDADDFRNLWHHRLSGLINSAAHATRDGAHTLHTNATQQRDASSADGGVGIFAGVPFPAGGLKDLIADAFLEAKEGVEPAVKWGEGAGLGAAVLLKYLPKGERFADLMAGLKDVHEFGHGIEWLGAGLDTAGLLANLAKDPHSPETLRSGIDVAFDAATLATTACPVVSAGFFVAHLGFDFLADHPEVAKAIGDGVVNTAKTVFDAEVSLAHAELKVAEGVVDAGKSIVSGGVNAVKSLFHW